MRVAHLGAWILLGLALRGLRVVARWDELALAYAAYAEPVARALEEGRYLRAATTWVGLHPPLQPLLLGLSEWLLPVPLLWLAGSALASLLAVVLVGRLGGPLAAALLATSPLQLADAAEVNNYPLATAMIALCLATARRSWWALGLSAGLACQTHLLAGAGGLLVVAWRLWQPGPRGERLRLLGLVTLLFAPVMVGALVRTGESDTFGQSGLDALAWLSMVRGAVGPVGLLLLPLGLLGLRGPALAAATGTGALLGLSLLLGAAAPHQRPYLDLLEPPLALGLVAALARAGEGTGGRLLRALVLLLCLGRGAVALAQGAQTVTELRVDQGRERAIDRALAEARPGETIWLVLPALQPDDDKSAVGPVLWRLPPWQRMPIARPVAFEYTDYRYGQPRRVGDWIVHTSTELDEQAFDHVASEALRRGRLFVVLAEHGPAGGLRERVERALRPYRFDLQAVGEDRGLGVDLLYRVEGRAAP